MSANQNDFPEMQELLEKSREAALTSIQVFNNPLIKFKSETFIVLMIIAWTYLLHAHYRKNGIDYRHSRTRNGVQEFDRTKSGAFRYWELESCLTDPNSPIDNVTFENLKFLIELRHEIEHQMTERLDDYIGSRYQACAMNYNRYIKALFGEGFGIDKYMTFSLQFLELSQKQLSSYEISDLVPQRLQTLILELDAKVTEDVYNDEAYAYRLFFFKKLENRRGQADQVVEFIDPKSEAAVDIATDHWVRKEVERPKLLPKQIVERMQAQGYTKFKIHQHTKLWKEHDAKNPAKGYGTMVVNFWYWYETWLRFVEDHCAANREHYV
jgi:hypothetical protein